MLRSVSHMLILAPQVEEQRLTARSSFPWWWPITGDMHNDTGTFSASVDSHPLLSWQLWKTTWSHLSSECKEVYSTFSGKSCRVTRQRDWVKFGGNSWIYHKLFPGLFLSLYGYCGYGNRPGSHNEKELLTSARLLLKIYRHRLSP